MGLKVVEEATKTEMAPEFDAYLSRLTPKNVNGDNALELDEIADTASVLEGNLSPADPPAAPIQ